MLHFIISVCLITCSATSAIDKETAILSDIESANAETQNLAEDLTDLLEKIEQEGDNVYADENLYHEIVEKIQELAEATEEENVIKLTETVKNKRIKEEELQNSVENLQRLAEKLEKVSKSTNNAIEKGQQMTEILDIATK